MVTLSLLERSFMIFLSREKEIPPTPHDSYLFPEWPRSVGPRTKGIILILDLGVSPGWVGAMNRVLEDSLLKGGTLRDLVLKKSREGVNRRVRFDELYHCCFRLNPFLRSIPTRVGFFLRDTRRTEQTRDSCLR